MCQFLLRYLIFGCFCLFCSGVNAQGCLINSNNIYSNPATVQLGVNVLSDLKLYSPPGVFTNNCISGSVSSTTACYVCELGGDISAAISVSSLIYIVTCNRKTNLAGLGPYYAATPGTYYSNYVLQCDLDDFTTPMAALAGLLGIVVIRKRRSI